MSYMCRVHFAETRWSSCVPFAARFILNEKHQVSRMSFASGVMGQNTVGVAPLHELVRGKLNFSCSFSMEKKSFWYQWTCIGDMTGVWRSADTTVEGCGSPSSVEPHHYLDEIQCVQIVQYPNRASFLERTRTGLWEELSCCCHAEGRACFDPTDPTKPKTFCGIKNLKNFLKFLYTEPGWQLERISR